jgi:hypothetical protein
MQIKQATSQRQDKTIMLRVTPDSYEKIRQLAKRARQPVAALCRLIIEGAIEEGIQIIPSGGGTPADAASTK